MNYTATIYLGGLAELRTMAETSKAIWDLVVNEGATLHVSMASSKYSRDRALFNVALGTEVRLLV